MAELTVKIEPGDIVEQVLDGYKYKGRTIREWADLLTKPNTNGDKLRAMSDEELAAFFNDDFLCPPGYATEDGILLTDKCAYHNDSDDEPCRRCWLGWLRQEVTE